VVQPFLRTYNIVARQLLAQISAARLFLQEWVQRPQQIGAIFPSSRHLSQAMADWLPADSDEYVLELGPGTGSVTEAMLNRGLRHDRLIALEKSSRMAGLLRERFPRARFITGDALNLDKLIRKQFKHLDTVGAVISSLPLRNFKPEDAHALAEKIHGILRPGGIWVQYSYYLGQERAKATAAFHLCDTHIVWKNLPPARLSAYQK
jgi:phosphatidylethanolamine/phosphatidyl-N-methylethanolamine N-methyltransferase